jgi:hypothetical protein
MLYLQGASMSNGSTTWDTRDEISRLQGLLAYKPLAVLAAYNGTLVRYEWGKLDEHKIKAEALKLAKRALMEDPTLKGLVPEDWPHARRLVESMKEVLGG